MIIIDLILLSVSLAVVTKAATKVSTSLFHIDFSFGKLSI